MPNPGENKRSLVTWIKVGVLSLLALLTPTPACTPTCYTPAAPPTKTPTPTPFDSPISPLPTPTSTPQALHHLQERLIAAGRFPESIARELES